MGLWGKGDDLVNLRTHEPQVFACVDSRIYILRFE